MLRSTLIVIMLVVNAVAFGQYRDTSYWVAEKMPSTINSQYKDTGPHFTHDGKQLFFTRIGDPSNLAGTNDVWFAEQDADGNWKEAEHLGEPLNNKGENLIHAISWDGKKILLHDEYKKNGTSTLGLSKSVLQDDGTWSFPEPYDFEKLTFNKGMISYHISKDWKTLIVSIKMAGATSNDLYVSQFDATNNRWGELKNLGKNVNSGGQEATMYLMDDNKTLYFSSNGRDDSKGGFDVYKTTRLDDSWTKWSDPENLGAPVNSAFDEFYFSIPTADPHLMYFARSDNQGGSDIFTVKKVTEKIKTDDIFVTGQLIDSRTKKPIKGSINFYKLPEYEDVGVSQGDKITEFVVVLKEGLKYEYRISVDGYKDKVAVINLKTHVNIVDGELRLDIYLDPEEIKKDDVFVLDNLEFESGKDIIRKQYFPMLDKLVRHMEKYPDISYEIGGHTDNVGSDASNQSLSERRAKAVYDYLLTKSIPASRLKYKGYGEAKPIADNGTKEGKQKNRRVELVPQDKK